MNLPRDIPACSRHIRAMTFRPFPILTLFTIPALALLLSLGNWQLERRAWKAELITQFESTAAQPAASVEEVFCRSETILGRSVTLPELGVAPSVRVYGTTVDGTPGWRVFTAIEAPDCLDADFILTESSFEPLGTLRAETLDGNERFVVYTEWRAERPVQASSFTPASNSETLEYYAFDPAMADHMALDGALSEAWWIARDSGALPVALTQTPPERHVGYAATWFLMAIALIAIYVLFHMRAGRLRFGKAS